jgi:hypothetical protein
MPEPGGRRDDGGTGLGVPEVGGLDDLVAVDRVLERLAGQGVQELAVVSLTRVGVDDEVRPGEARARVDVDARHLQRVRARRGHARRGGDRVDGPGLQRLDERVGIGEELDTEPVDVGLRAVPVRVAAEERDLVVLV